MRFGSPIARSISSPLASGVPCPIRSAFRFSQPPDGLLLKIPCGLVSCHWHFRGSPSRAFPLDAAPFSRRVWLPTRVVSFSSQTNRRRPIQKDSCLHLTRRCGAKNKYYPDRSLSTSRSVRIPLWFYPPRAADTLLGCGAFEGSSPDIPDCLNHPLMYFISFCRQPASRLRAERYCTSES
jgi:hypothetical protein